MLDASSPVEMCLFSVAERKGEKKNRSFLGKKSRKYNFRSRLRHFFRENDAR